MHSKNLAAYVLVFALLALLAACEGKKDETGKAPQPASERAEKLPTPADVPQAEPTPAPALGQAEDVENKAAKAAPPEILSLKLEPSLIFPGTRVKALAEASESQGNQTTLEFRWENNGEPLAGEIMDELDTSGLRKGDVITVLVTPSSGELQGEGKRSQPVVILNRPPEITSLPTPAVKDGVFTYAVTASDPDGDTLNFSLENPPQGMKIDADTGMIDWAVPAGFHDKVQVQIVVSDGDARAFQSFDMTVSNK